MTREIPLTQGKFAIIDDDDFDIVNKHKWCAVKDGGTFYARTNVLRKGGGYIAISMHRLILGLIPNDGKQVDHRDCDGLNNTRANIRFSTQTENLRNQRISSRNKSGFKGVSWFKRDKKWKADIRLDGKGIFLGIFATKEEAHQAYCMAATEYFGKFARVR